MTAGNSAVGIVGLGSMGLGMARTLAGKGFRVLGTDLAPARRAAAREAGAEVLADAGAVFAGADAVVLSLPAAADVAAVVRRSLPDDRGGRRVVIDTSTSEAAVSRQLAGELEPRGWGFLDAPVSGGPAGAAAGSLTMMIGGSEGDVALARPVIEAMAARILHVGPSGAGNVAKLVNNLLVAAHLITTSEGLRLAAAAGLDPEAALRVINAASGRSAISEIHFPAWVMSNRFDSGFTMGLMRKDVRLARALAADVGADLPLSDVVARLWEGSAARLADGDDFTRMGAFAETPADKDGTHG